MDSVGTGICVNEGTPYTILRKTYGKKPAGIKAMVLILYKLLATIYTKWNILAHYI